MHRQEFMSAMEQELKTKGRTAPEISEILSDFEEHIVNGISGGRTEEDVVTGLGDPKDLAAQYAEGQEARTPPSTVTAGGVGRGILAALGLFFFDLLIALPILMSLFAVVVSLWAVPIAIGTVGGSLIVASFFPVGFLSIPFSGVHVPGLVYAFAGISLLAFAVLFGIGMYFPSKWFVLGVKAFAIAHARIVKGGSRS